MIPLQHIKLTRNQLAGIPETERILIILLSHAANELTVLTKLFSFCSRHVGQGTLLEQEATNTQALVIGKVITGKLHECWVLLQQAFFGSKLAKTYVPLFDEPSKKTLDNLKRYFSQPNLVNTVRNRFAFHYAPDQIPAGYSKLADNDSLDIYLSEDNGNTLYAFAETIVGRSMLEAIDPADHDRAFKALVKESGQVIGWFNEVIAACLMTCLGRYIGDNLQALGAQVIEIANAPKFEDVSIPYFVTIAN